MNKTDEPIVVRVLLNSQIEKVWDAITKLNKMKLWYFDNIDAFIPNVGSKSRFVVRAGERTFTHLWEITEVEAPKQITYNWKYEEYDGDSFVKWELFEKKIQTELLLTVVVAEDFPDDIPEFTRESCIGCWKYIIGDRLKDYVEKSM